MRTNETNTFFFQRFTSKLTILLSREFIGIIISMLFLFDILGTNLAISRKRSCGISSAKILYGGFDKNKFPSEFLLRDGLPVAKVLTK